MPNLHSPERCIWCGSHGAMSPTPRVTISVDAAYAIESWTCGRCGESASVPVAAGAGIPAPALRAAA